jgi:DNA-binding transcriptional LysR family regulator
MDQLRALRVLIRVANEGGFAAAARSLDMAPAVVTRTVAALEAHLGARLINRTTRTLALTEIGETYVAQTTALLAALDDADAQAGAGTKAPSGVLRVLAPPAFAVHQLARHLPGFRALYPRLGIEIATPGAVETANGNFDVSIVSVAQQGLQGEFTARKLARSHFVVCAAPAYLSRCGWPQHPDALLGHDAVLLAVPSVKHALTLTRHAHLLGPGVNAIVRIPAPKAVLSSSHIDVVFAAAVAGLGIAGLPSFVAHDALRDGRLQRVLPDWHGTVLTLYAAMPTSKHLPARTRAFVDFLVARFGGTDHDPWLSSVPARSP